MPENPALLTITPNNPNPIPTDRYVRLLVVISTGLLLLLVAFLMVRGLALIHHTVLLFALGGLLAYALDPIVEWVRGRPVAVVPKAGSDPAAPPPGKVRHPRRQRPRWLGVVTVFAVLTAAMSLGVFFLGREMVREVERLVRHQEDIKIRAKDKLAEVDTYLQAHHIPIKLADTIQHPPESVKKWGEDATRTTLNVVGDFTRNTVEGLVVVLIAVYFLLFSEELRGHVTNLFPTHLRPYMSQWQDDANNILGGFVRGQAILALALGAGAAIVCFALQLNFWLLIGAFVVVASLVPVIGPYIGTVPAILSAILTPPHLFSPGVRVVLVVVLFVAINEIGSKIIYPRLVGKALGLHEMLVLFVLLAGLEVGGIVGTLLAAPITALVLVTIRQLYRLWLGMPPASHTASGSEVDMPTAADTTRPVTTAAEPTRAKSGAVVAVLPAEAKPGAVVAPAVVGKESSASVAPTVSPYDVDQPTSL